MAVFSHPDFDQHQCLSFHHDPASGLKAIIAIHNSNLGPATGGCRMFPYTCEEAALGDVLRLSRGMTYKSALAGIPFGGGKAVIIGDPLQDKSRALLLAMGDFVDSQNGRYTIAEDSGTSVDDMAVIAERTRHVSGIIAGAEHGGDPSPVTAYGVFIGIRAAVAYRFGGDLKGVRVAIQGVGSVGFQLARLLVEAGAIVCASDVNARNIQRAVSELGVTALPSEQLLTREVEVFSPCALGAVINSDTVAGLRAQIVAGAANNQLATPEMGEQLLQQHILYAPDYVINAGGIIDVYYQTLGQHQPQQVQRHVDRIAETLSNIFKRSSQEGCPTSRIADAMAEEIFKPPVNDSKVA